MTKTCNKITETLTKFEMKMENILIQNINKTIKVSQSY